MKSDERHVLELYGAYSFVVDFVPCAWYEAQRRPIELIRSEDQSVVRSWWQFHEPNTAVAHYFDEHFARTDGSPYAHDLWQTCWVDENHHRVEFWESEGGKVVYLYAYIDARYDYAEFINTIVNFAKISDCVLFFESEESFAVASTVEVYSALTRSRAAKLASEDAVRLTNH
jgi:hypothetical protein